jgi:imidazolonepropionase-like amidohydrolase
MVHPYAKETFQRIHQAGIKIAMGTDIFIDPAMGSNAYELEVYVDYGMTPMEAIQTATQHAAVALGLQDDLGTLQAGKIADVIAIEGNPLRDIRILQDRKQIRLVMKEGIVFVDKRPGREKYVIHDQEWGWDRI